MPKPFGGVGEVLGFFLWTSAGSRYRCADKATGRGARWGEDEEEEEDRRGRRAGNSPLARGQADEWQLLLSSPNRQSWSWSCAATGALQDNGKQEEGSLENAQQQRGSFYRGVATGCAHNSRRGGRFYDSHCDHGLFFVFIQCKS